MDRVDPCPSNVPELCEQLALATLQLTFWFAVHEEHAVEHDWTPYAPDKLPLVQVRT
ncbi:hypothetical protein [Hyphomicrobium sp.]|uniref:hypothetical protein n=1 Tax=Hyphomicrobium sp. TaxID=82 RepID=UPI003F724225